ncbi:MAG TPA: anti-sigma factor [Solirubrobacteraceae bacterium]|nr:anti-sigma factor [Solirubrobacteraceae bacterium]
MSVENGRECGENAAAYVLGALGPAEAEAFRRHIDECAACRDEVAAFEQITEALPASTGRSEMPRDLRRRVMREVRATPKTAPAGRAHTVRAPSRVSFAWGGALAAGIVAVIVAIVLVSSGGSSGTRVIQASVGSAELHIAGGRGDLVVHRLPPLPAGRIYEMWVQRGTAAPTPTGTLFSTRANGSANVGVPGSLNGVSRVMVTQEPAGGTLAPTSAPVIVAPVT